MNLDRITETTQEEDPFSSPYTSSLEKWHSFEKTERVLQSRIAHTKERMKALINSAQGVGILSFSQMRQEIDNGKAAKDDFVSVDLNYTDYYVRKNSSTSGAAKMLKLSDRLTKDQELLKQLPDRRKKHLKGAADEHIKNGKVKFEPQVIAQSELREAIRTYDKDGKHKWTHNPVMFGDDPKYAGSPQHYDWKSGPMSVMYFQMVNALNEGILYFDKVFAAVDEGEPWVVAVAANHAFVWVYHEKRGTVYMPHIAPMSASTFLGMNKTQMHTTMVEVVKYSKMLDDHGRPKAG